MLNYKTLKLMYQCKVVPEPIFKSIEFLHDFTNALIVGNADWDEVKLVSENVQSVYNASYMLYCDDQIKDNAWYIIKDALKEFIEMFRRMCHDNRVLEGDWEWVDKEL
ncbi:hypothetical protein [Bacillus phage Sarmo]|nr:hypothetical protein [Bacillus phage Sarmo]